MRQYRVGVFILLARAVLAQHEYTGTDAQIGAQIYLNNCVYCHGPDGDQIPGVNLTHGKFKRAVTDDDLVQTILKGIPDAGMPAQKMPDAQARTIVAYLRASAANPTSDLPAGGDAARGKAIVEGKGGCLNCHRIQGSGGRIGPDLSVIGSQRRVLDLQKKLADPSSHIEPQNRIFRAVSKDGTVTTGRILNQDTFTVQLIDARGRLLSFARSDLREFAYVEKSPMPSFRGKLSDPETTDLLTYLVSLKGH